MYLSPTIPLSLYIHFPWCIKKCPYCDFNSHAKKEAVPEQAYINQLLNELDTRLPEIWGRRIVSIFMGGGTPSLFAPESMEVLLNGLRARLNILPNIEITMEANPGSLEHGQFAAYRDIGINRLSIGVQSFQGDFLEKLGRIHSGNEAVSAIQAAQAGGFDNINIDLMHALPDQTVTQAMQDLETAVSLNPQHISWYQLTLEPNTLFYNHPPVLPKEQAILEMQQAGWSYLDKLGYHRYEVSAFSKPSYQAQHNINYWLFGDYLGIGAGAHSKISQYHDQSVTRTMTQKHPRTYLTSQAFIAETRQVSMAEVPLEFMMNALRLVDGFEKKLYSERTGTSWDSVQDAMELLLSEGLVEVTDTNVKMTTKGLMYLDEILQRFIP